MEGEVEVAGAAADVLLGERVESAKRRAEARDSIGTRVLIPGLALQAQVHCMAVRTPEAEQL